MLTREEALLQAVWLKALAEGSVSLRRDSEGEAKRLRLRLYSAVRMAKRDPFINPKLHEAAMTCEIVIRKGDRLTEWFVIIRDKAHDPMLVDIASQIGFDSPPATPEEEEAALSEKRLLDSLLEPKDE